MVHLDKRQYPALRAFSSHVRKELITKNLDKSISDSTWIEGQNHGFCHDEIKEIIELCYEDLVQITAK